MTLAPLLGTGCIIAEAPDYGEPPGTPIFLSEPAPSPSDLVIMSSDTQASTLFTVTVRSEDAGVPLVDALYVDYEHGVPSDSLISWYPLQAATIDIPRSVTYSVRASSVHFQDTGCHSLTLMVMHVTSWNDQAQIPKGSPADLALMTWFVSIDRHGHPRCCQAVSISPGHRDAMTSVFVRGALLACSLSLAGCAVAPGTPSLDQRAVNQCQTDANCMGGGRCMDNGSCQGTEGDFTALLLAVAPSASDSNFASVTFYDTRPLPPSGPNTLDIEVGQTVAFSGYVRIAATTGAATFMPTTGPSAGTELAQAADLSIPADVTFVPERARARPADNCLPRHDGVRQLQDRRDRPARRLRRLHPSVPAAHGRPRAT